MQGAPNRWQLRTARAIFALAVVGACLASVAYAATRFERAKPAPKNGQQQSRSQRQGPPRPELIEVPPAPAVGAGFQFRFHIAPPPQPSARRAPSGPANPAQRRRQFQCRLDDGGWTLCSSPRVLAGLDPGEHAFAVRALSPGGQPGLVAYYHWLQLEPKELRIDPLFGSLEELMPGAPPQQLPVRIDNPNPVPIEVTGLTVAVTPSSAACTVEPNFSVVPSNLTSNAPLGVPAGGSVSLPSGNATAPTLSLRELPSDQNACQGATLQLSFQGEARG